ncbi:ROK family protein [Xinfangfangia sp. D13-10-4-6]|nr:ROK family protein [Pseudogemmobacter hezensis]
MAGRGGLGKNPTRSRDHNRRIVLDLLRQTSPLGRKALAEATQLSGPAVANILDDLLREGLILDMGRRKAEGEKQGRGQPPLHFALNPRGAHTLGFEISVRGVVSVMLDLVGTQISQQVLAPSGLGLHEGLAVIRQEITRAAALNAGPLMGVGIVHPGGLAIEGQETADPTTLGDWDNVSRDALAQLLGAPVWLENDANAAALSEALFGMAAHLNDVAVLYFGEGLGLGALQAGRLMRGARGHAGEIGHIVVVPDGKACSCGQRGCLERYVSRHALSEALGIPLGRGTVTSLWQDQDPRLMGWIAAAGGHLGQVVSMVENLLDPESIILSGQLPAPVLQALIAATPLRPSVAAHSARLLPRLQPGHAGIFTAALGAAALPFYDAMSP